MLTAMTGLPKRSMCLLVAAAALMTSGCSGGGSDDPNDSPSSPSSSSSSTPSETPSASATTAVNELAADEIGAWVENLMSQDARRIAKARKVVAAGSVADTYAAYRLASANSNLDGGYPQDAQDVTPAGESFQACPPDDSTGCATFADFQQTDGLLEKMTINGKDLQPRLVAGPGRKTLVAGLATVQFLVAYRAVTDDSLIVAVKLSAGAEAISILDSSYRATNGRQTQSENISGPLELGARSSATYTMAFPLARPGGAATLRFYTDGAPVPATVNVARK